MFLGMIEAHYLMLLVPYASRARRARTHTQIYIQTQTQTQTHRERERERDTTHTLLDRAHRVWVIASHVIRCHRRFILVPNHKKSRRDLRALRNERD